MGIRYQIPIYTDNRITLSYPETRNLIEDGFVQRIEEEFSEVEVITELPQQVFLMVLSLQIG